MREALAEWRPVVDRELERLVPREITVNAATELFGAPTYAYDVAAIQAAVSTPIWDLLDRGGKRWRAVLFLVLVEAFGEDPEAYLPYACVPEILHNGTIIVDDVEDDASLRRGEPALHLKYGTDVALNAGNAMYFLALDLLARDPADLDAETRLAAYETLLAELNRTHVGQGMDIQWHNEREIRVTEDEYLEMCACKTGCLGRIVARLAAIVTGQPSEVEQAVAEYAEHMSVAFQIADDVLDAEAAIEGDGGFGKAIGNDVREGKKTLMAIHAAENASPAAAARLEEILWAEENSAAEIGEAIGILDETDSIDYARERALDLSASARERLDGLDLEPDPADDLAAFTRFVVSRNV
ncbi:polyprenyl synthetase [Halobacteriales archaeon QS_8_65_32]|nr:MAG: polyprenyl synthetase [Halobacteriales archaeon QS_8_65_32]